MLMMVLANPEKGWVLSALERHEASLLRFAATIVGPDDARDVIQDTFLELCRAKQGDVEGHLVPWLFTVCRNKALTLRRGTKRRAN